MTDETDARLEALWLKGEMEWLRDRIADHCEDHGSSDRTLAGIANAKDRARCEIAIKREQRDHAKCVREHNARAAILRARNMVREQERRLRESRSTPDAGPVNPFTLEIDPRKIMQRFNRRVTGKRGD